MIILAVNKAVVNNHFIKTKGDETKVANRDLKLLIRGSGLTQYEVAEALGWPETSFCRRLRKELPQEEKETILKVIDALKSEKEGGK